MSKGSLRKRFVVIGNGVTGYSATFTIKKYQKKAIAIFIIVSYEHYPLYSACSLANYLEGEGRRKANSWMSLSSYKHERIITKQEVKR